MRPKPYIGITGFTARSQINAVLGNGLPAVTDQLVMVGLLISSRTMRGETNKWPNRYPKPGDLEHVFVNDKRLLNLIHFNTNIKDLPFLLDHMRVAQELAGPACNGFQLNIAWPDPEVLEKYKKAPGGNNTIVLQCGRKAIEEAGNVHGLATRLRRYDGLADYVLVDPSGGLGKDFNYADMYATLETLFCDAPQTMGIGIAGGLSPDNLDRLRPLLEEFEFSIDAEGNLRDADDHLDITVASSYLRESVQLYRECGQAL
ncbi:MAG: hypothetical protein KA066_02195 [Candidatus Pacebacteria bacterium]|nr:hypothetical protein [Candidatus Paceibacterota bacterium]